MAEKMKVNTKSVNRPDDDTYTPLVDICENPDGSTVLTIEVPGAATDKVDVSVDKGVLTVYADGRVAPADPKYTRTYSGFGTGQYFRAFALGDEVDRDNIDATLTDGVLTVRLPRGAAARTRKIEIKGE